MNRVGQAPGLSKLGFQTPLIWTATAQSAAFVRADGAAGGPIYAALTSAWSLFTPSEARHANLDSTWPQREPDSEMAAMLIEIKGLNPSRWQVLRLIWTALGKPYPYAFSVQSLMPVG